MREKKHHDAKKGGTKIALGGKAHASVYVGKVEKQNHSLEKANTLKAICLLLFKRCH